jgi:hypothetical protein
MGEAETTDRLEKMEIEVRNPTIVLSVRLDDATARQLRTLARERGIRISELLREAAVSLAESASKMAAAESTPYDVAYLNTALAVGVATRRTMPEVKAHDLDGPWSSAPITSVSAAG